MMKWINLTLLVLLSVLQFRLWVGEGSVSHILSLDQKIAQQQNDNNILLARNDALAIEVIELQNGYASIEAYARRDLGMIKSDETFFLIIPSDQ